MSMHPVWLLKVFFCVSTTMNCKIPWFLHRQTSLVRFYVLSYKHDSLGLGNGWQRACVKYLSGEGVSTQHECHNIRPLGATLSSQELTSFQFLHRPFDFKLLSWMFPLPNFLIQIPWIRDIIWILAPKSLSKSCPSYLNTTGYNISLPGPRIITTWVSVIFIKNTVIRKHACLFTCLSNVTTVI